MLKTTYVLSKLEWLNISIQVYQNQTLKARSISPGPQLLLLGVLWNSPTYEEKCLSEIA